MSEYWKSTPKYWCKHCSVYVRDTKLERTNHESTGKHQGAIKRSLRDLHRNAEQQERDKDRAKREIERLNGVVAAGSGSGSGSGANNAGGASGAGRGGSKSLPQQQQVTEAERQKQLEQLAELGVNIPTELRGNMAMAGEWTVTTTRVVKEETGDADANTARATGVKRERERTEEEKEQEEAIKGLFTKRRKWGVGSKTMPSEDDAELDALLSGPLVVAKKEEEPRDVPVVKKEEKKEEEADGQGQAEVGNLGAEQSKESAPFIKKEPGQDEADGGAALGPAVVEEEVVPISVMFKKRKPKNVRQK